MKKYQYCDLQPYQYHIVTLAYEYPNDNDHLVEFIKLLGIVTTPPQTVQAVLAEYFTGEPLSQLNEDEISQLSLDTLYKMSGADLIPEIENLTTHDENGCILSVQKIQSVNFEQFHILRKFANLQLINIIV